MSSLVAHCLSPAHVSQAPTMGLTLSAQRKAREEAGPRALGDKAQTRHRVEGSEPAAAASGRSGEGGLSRCLPHPLHCEGLSRAGRTRRH